jgi:hypothetical protein
LSKRTKILWALLAVFLMVIIGFVVWAQTPLGPMPEVRQSLKSNTEVEVTRGKWIIWTPQGVNPTTGLIIFPGGRVDPRSYAPLAQKIASRGFLVTIVPMPLNLAVLGSGRATAIIKSYPDIVNWAIGGHSPGGTMAGRFAYRNPSLIKGVTTRLE